MFKLDEFYKEAHSGKIVDDAEVIKYIKSFKHVVIWGASYLGAALGKYLINKDVRLESYWDIRNKELKEVNGIKVIPPFSSKEKDETLIVYCIGNNVIIHELLMELRDQGYKNVLRGDYLYMGTVCPFSVDTGINAKRCSGTMECRQVYCHRLGNIVKEQNKNENPIHLTSVTLVINQRCSLSCKFCTSYMNQYPVNERKDIPFERISDDIDKFFGSIDSVGTITVMGGEPFMHKDLSKIIEKLCEKKNFGLISIATSGTYPITKEQLEGLHDPRVNVSFSNYTQSINEKQNEMFLKNIEIVKESEVCYTIGLPSPEWIIPTTLVNRHYDNQRLIDMKKNCMYWIQIKNGKIHPCDVATAVYSLGIQDISSDYVDLTGNISSNELKEKIRSFIDQPCFQSCNYHKSQSGMTAKAAEQGYYNFLLENNND